MITINAITKTVTNAKEHDPILIDTPFGVLNQTPGYIRGWLPPRYPMPVTARVTQTVHFVTDIDEY